MTSSGGAPHYFPFMSRDDIMLELNARNFTDRNLAAIKNFVENKADHEFMPAILNANLIEHNDTDLRHLRRIQLYVSASTQTIPRKKLRSKRLIPLTYACDEVRFKFTLKKSKTIENVRDCINDIVFSQEDVPANLCCLLYETTQKSIPCVVAMFYAPVASRITSTWFYGKFKHDQGAKDVINVLSLPAVKQVSKMPTAATAGNLLIVTEQTALEL